MRRNRSDTVATSGQPDPTVRVLFRSVAISTLLVTPGGGIRHIVRVATRRAGEVAFAALERVPIAPSDRGRGPRLAEISHEGASPSPDRRSTPSRTPKLEVTPVGDPMICEPSHIPRPVLAVSGRRLSRCHNECATVSALRRPDRFGEDVRSP